MNPNISSGDNIPNADVAAVRWSSSWVLLSQWVLATIFGGALGLVAARFVVRLYDAASPARFSLAYATPNGDWILYWLDFGTGILAGVFVWTGAGIAQWFVLRSRQVRAVPWIFACSLG